MSKPREELIAEMSDKWWSDCRAAGFTSNEGTVAAAHLIYQLLREAPSMDVAASQLSDVYMLLMQRLLKQFGNPVPPSKRSPT
jgi:hypothetical protein